MTTASPSRHNLKDSPSTSPMKSRLSPRHQKKSATNDILDRANEALSEGRAEDAISLFTNVLYHTSPGHVCALLNRSLSYLLAGYFELAAADAYRAAISAHEMRDIGVFTENAKFMAQYSYLQMEETRAKKDQSWTKGTAKYVGDGWAQSPLASIVVNHPPDVTKFDLTESQKSSMNLKSILSTDRNDLCAALEVRAMYRLIRALFLCGGGARHDALGLLDDALTNLDAIKWERLHMLDLGKEIITDIVHEAQQGCRSVSVQGVGHDPGYELSSVEKHDRMELIKRSMRERSIRIAYNDYPLWNQHEPDLRRSSWQGMLHTWIKDYGKNCVPRVFASADMVNEQRKPFAKLCVDRDFSPGECVMSESPIHNVNTNNARQSLTSMTDKDYSYLFCDVCSSLLIVPRTFNIHFRSEKPSKKYEIPQRPFRTSDLLFCKPENTDSKGSSLANPTNMQSPVEIAPAAQRSSPEAPPVNSLDHRPDHQRLRFCSLNHIAPICSDHCDRIHRTFDHAGICGTNLEDAVYKNTFMENLSLPALDREGREIQTLTDLMLLRIMAQALQNDLGLLQIPEVIFATAGLDMNERDDDRFGKQASRSYTWSFTSNIVRPISILQRICRSARIDQFVHLSKTDGWMLNLVLAKTSDAVHISSPSSSSLEEQDQQQQRQSHNPHPTKVYNKDAKASACFLPHQQLPEGVNLPASVCSVRVARLTPITDMICVADPKKGQRANVKLEYGDAIRVIAIEKIREGELLMKAASTVGGAIETMEDDFTSGTEQSQESTDKIDEAIEAKTE